MSESSIFIKKLHLRNFRSIREETIDFVNPLFLVGRNGTGKSNVIEALSFLSDCMSLQLQGAVDKRLGIGAIDNYEMRNDDPFIELSIVFHLGNSDFGTGTYGFKIDVRERSKYKIVEEFCTVHSAALGEERWFRRVDNLFDTNIVGIKPALTGRGLILPVFGGLEEFGDLLHALTSIRVYDIDQRAIRHANGAEGSDILESNAANLEGVIANIFEKRGDIEDINDYLHSVNPTPVRVVPQMTRDGKATLVVEQIKQNGHHVGPWPKADMSDGFLRGLALFTALNQDPKPTLIVLEEPENNIHAGALNSITDAIEFASSTTQIVITTHSPDILDAKWIMPENIRVVTWADGATRVSELAEMPTRALRDHLYYAGQLLRKNALDSALSDDEAERVELPDPTLSVG